MTDIAQSGARTAPALDLVQFAQPLRDLVFVASFLLAWLTLSPFQSLASSAGLDITTGNDVLSYLAFALLATMAAALSAGRLRRALPRLLTLPILAMGGWLVVTSVISRDSGTSLKRLALFLVLAVLTSCLFLLPRDSRSLARLLAIVTGILIVLSYAGLVLAPNLSIHQAFDFAEPELAGDWRGVFSHKNVAGAVFSLCVFFGIYIARQGWFWLGSAIAALSGIFVLGAGAKSSMMLVVVAFCVSMVWEWSRNPALRIGLALLPAMLLNMFGIGSVMSPTLAAITRALPLDATFTGRTDIWIFAINQVRSHLLTGFGFQAFWNTESTRFGTTEEGWAGQAAHAHNGYLDLVVNMGLPGLALGLLVFFAGPLRDYWAAERRGTDPALLGMLFQVWLFGMYLSATETFIFNLQDPIWVTFLFAFFGLRFVAVFRLKKVS